MGQHIFTKKDYRASKVKMMVACSASVNTVLISSPSDRVISQVFLARNSGIRLEPSIRIFSNRLSESGVLGVCPIILLVGVCPGLLYPFYLITWLTSGTYLCRYGYLIIIASYSSFYRSRCINPFFFPRLRMFVSKLSHSLGYHTLSGESKDQEFSKIRFSYILLRSGPQDIYLDPYSRFVNLGKYY